MQYVTSNTAKSMAVFKAADQPGQHAKVRFSHKVAGAPDVNVEVDGQPTLSGLTYKNVTDYLEVPSGQHRVTVKLPGPRGDTTLVDTTVTLQPTKKYTAIVHGLASKPNTIDALVLEDDSTCPAPGKAHVRVIHPAADVDAAGVKGVDVVANGAAKVVENIKYGQHTTYFPIEAGKEVTLSLHPHTPKAIGKAVASLTVKPEEGKIYSFFATGKPGDEKHPLGVVVTEDSKGACVIHHGMFHHHRMSHHASHHGY